MRRILGLMVVALLLTTAHAALASQGGYEDGFDGGDFSGDAGSLEFSGPWTEFGDPGGGGHVSGWIHVAPDHCADAPCLHIEGDGLFVSSFGVKRYADLSLLESVDLSYEIEVTPGLLTTTELLVQVYDGSRWLTVEEHDLSIGTRDRRLVDVDSYASEDFGLRFMVSDAISGGLPGLDVLYDGEALIDDVWIRGVLNGQAVTTSTSTSTSSSSSTTPTSTAVDSTPSASPSTTSATAATTTVPGATGPPLDPSTTVTTSPSGGTGTTTAHPSTTTTVSDSTTTSTGIVAIPPNVPPYEDGLRQTAVGVIADYRPGAMGDTSSPEVEVLGLDLHAEFSMLVEVIQATGIWAGALALLITIALIGGMERRRSTTIFTR